MSGSVPPPPPEDFDDREPLIVRLGAGSTISRFHAAAHDPVFFDRSLDGRFNAPDGAYGVLYAAATTAGAFAETFLRQPGATLIASDFLARKAYAVLRLERDLNLIQFHGPGLARLGATAQVVHDGLPYDVAHRWSAALHAHPVRADGVAYRARHDDDEICYALFDGRGVAVVPASRAAPLDADWFWELAENYGVGLAT